MKTIEYAGDETAFVGAVHDTLKAVGAGRGGAGKTVLVFSYPTVLRNGPKCGQAFQGTRIEVSSIFLDSASRRMCYAPGRMRNRGFFVPLETLVCAEVPDVRPDHSAKWAALARSMREHGINLDVADNIEKHLRGESEHMTWAQNYYTRYDAPRIADFSDLAEGWTIPRMVEAATPRSQAYEKDPEIKKHSFRDFSRSVDGIKRDRSISLYIVDEKEVRYHAASEFHGCGNGHYYVMFSTTKAVYAEAD